MVTVWMHGDDVVGRVTPLRDSEGGMELGRAYESSEAICVAVRDFIDAFAARRR